MKAKEMRDLAVDEMRRKEAELRDEIFRLRMKRAASALDNKMLIRNRRHDLARIQTVLRQKAKGEAK
jgi:large subunit ribosomal protein L29